MKFIFLFKSFIAFMTLKSVFFLVLIMILYRSNLFCQSIIIDVQSSGGGYYDTPYAKVQFNIGEIVTENYDLNFCLVNSGFEQGIKSIGGTDIATVFPTDFSISMFPNPTKGTVSVKFSEEIKQSLSIEIVDLFGKKLNELTLNQERVFDISEFPDGIYFVSFIIDNLPSNEKYKIIKID
jgi:hypothetical protein